MEPVFGEVDSGSVPSRMVLVNRGLGFHAEDFFPSDEGADYTATPYLDELSAARGDFTVFSGLSHPHCPPGHLSEDTILTAATYTGAATFKNTVSLDQYVAGHIAGQTRIPFLALCTHFGSLSWTERGVAIPADRDPSAVFARLFLEGSPREKQAQQQAFRSGRSILDSVRTETAALQRRVGAGDRERLDQYFTAVREAESRLQNAEVWSQRPKPEVPVKRFGPFPDASDIIGRTRMVYELMHLALVTDSTRLITFSIDSNGGGTPPIKGVGDNRHNLSHHGLDPDKLAQLRRLELEEIRCLAELLTSLQGSTEAGDRLLDRTMLFYGSNLGNASSHDTRNLPIILAGGGFRHGRHLRFGQDTPPLGNLFVSMLQQFGLPAETFGTGTGTLTGLEAA